jgi:cell division protease FtsH
MRRTKLAPDVDAEKVAGLTPGFTGADLATS